MVTEAAYLRQIVNMLVNTKSNAIQSAVKINTKQCTTCSLKDKPTPPQANSVSFKVNGIIEHRAAMADPISILGEGLTGYQK